MKREKNNPQRLSLVITRPIKELRSKEALDLLALALIEFHFPPLRLAAINPVKNFEHLQRLLRRHWRRIPRRHRRGELHALLCVSL